MSHATKARRITRFSRATDSRILFSFVLAGLFLCGLLLRPFISALTGTALIALATRSPIAWLRRRVGSKTSVAAIGIVLVSSCIVVPSIAVATTIGHRFWGAVILLQKPEASSRLRDGMATLRTWLASSDLPVGSFDPAAMVNSIVAFLASTVMSLLSSSVSTATQIVIMLFLLFFWYRDEDRFRVKAKNLFALSQSDRRFVLRRLRVCVRATVVGRMIVAAVQGLLAWGVFIALEVPGASLLANATTVCSLIPAFGAFIIWVPVVVYLLLIHAWVKAVVLLLIGSLVLSTVDNILFPIIVGSRSHMNTPEMFLSVFGGISMFGISGLVVGPLVWVMTEALVSIWLRRNANPILRSGSPDR